MPKFIQCPICKKRRKQTGLTGHLIWTHKKNPEDAKKFYSLMKKYLWTKKSSRKPRGHKYVKKTPEEIIGALRKRNQMLYQKVYYFTATKPLRQKKKGGVR